MKKQNFSLPVLALINAFATVVYTAGVAWFLYNGDHLFGKMRDFLVRIAAWIASCTPFSGTNLPTNTK